MMRGALQSAQTTVEEFFQLLITMSAQALNETSQGHWERVCAFGKTWDFQLWDLFKILEFSKFMCCFWTLKNYVYIWPKELK